MYCDLRGVLIYALAYSIEPLAREEAGCLAPQQAAAHLPAKAYGASLTLMESSLIALKTRLAYNRLAARRVCVKTIDHSIP